MTDSICEDSSKLSVRGLVKRFDGKETLHNLTFDVREGEFLSILGPSGCGKTTTLRILIGWMAGISRARLRTTAAWASCSRTMRCLRT